MRQSYNTKEKNLETLLKTARDSEHEYVQLLTAISRSGNTDYHEDYDRACERLKVTMGMYATIIELHPTHATAHHRLGLMIEENQQFRDAYEPPSSKGTHAGGDLSSASKDADPNDDDLPDGMFDQGSSINKEDDIRAICELHAVSRNAPLTAVLKAIDAEYQQLKEVGNFQKADYVQGSEMHLLNVALMMCAGLYSWKSKQAKSISSRGSIVSQQHQEGPLPRAALKYMDAWSIDQLSREYVPFLRVSSE
jgi:hypothetical protein